MRYSTLTVGNGHEAVRKVSDDVSLLKKQNSFKEEILPQYGSAQELSSSVLNEVKEEGDNSSRFQTVDGVLIEQTQP